MNANLQIVRSQDVSDVDMLTQEITGFYEQAPVDRCIIYQTGVQTTLVRRVDVGAEPPKDLAARLLRIIDQDAASWSKGSHYQIQVFSDGNMLGRIPLERTPPMTNALAESEPANEAGVLAQTMRHHEGMTRIHVGGLQYVMTRLEAENKRLLDENKELRAHSHAVFKTQGELMLREVDVESHREKSAMRTQMESALWQQVIGTAPAAMKMFMAQLTGGDSSPLTMIREFVAGISDEEQMAVYFALKESNREKFTELMGIEKNQDLPKSAGAHAPVITPIATPTEEK